jgi:hypothetical protein
MVIGIAGEWTRRRTKERCKIFGVSTPNRMFMGASSHPLLPGHGPFVPRSDSVLRMGSSASTSVSVFTIPRHGGVAVSRPGFAGVTESDRS